MSEPCSRFPNRLLLETMYNVRDLGGFATANGEVTAFGQFLRSDAPTRLSESDLRLFLAFPVRTVIDLRSRDEIDEAPHILRDHPDVEYVNIPLLGHNLMAGIAEVEASASHQTRVDLSDLYIYMLINAKPAIGQVMSRLASARPGACLFHCTHGKDRTGIITALLLMLAGVDDIDIIVNYQVSSTYLKPWFETFIDTVPDEYRHFLDTRPQNMVLTLEFFHQNYSSVRDYLTACGVTDAEMEMLRRRLLC